MIGLVLASMEDALIKHLVSVCTTPTVRVDWLQMFPGTTVPLALGLYVVTVWCSSLVNNGPKDKDVLTMYQGLEEYLLA